MSKQDLLGSWLRLNASESKDGQPLPGHEATHQQAYFDFSDAVYSLAKENRLNDVVAFAKESLPENQSHALFMDTISLATRYDEAQGKNKVASTRLFALPISGPHGQLQDVFKDPAFAEAIKESGLFSKDSQIVLLGAASIQSCSSLSLDYLAKLTQAFEAILGEGDTTPMLQVGSQLTHLLGSVEDNQPGKFGHAVIIGVCRQVATLDILDEADNIESPTPESDQAWVEQFEKWSNSSKQHQETPWMTSPPAKWEAGLSDAIVQASLLELALGVETPSNTGEMPRATHYLISENQENITITGFINEPAEDSVPMGYFEIGSTAKWLIPAVISEWKSWGCPVEYRPQKAKKHTFGRLH